jgi:hypothetical protein
MPELKRSSGRSRRRWKDIIKMNIECVQRNWSRLAQDRGEWRDLVRAIMIFPVAYNAGISSLAEQLIACQEIFCYMELVR